MATRNPSAADFQPLVVEILQKLIGAGRLRRYRRALQESPVRRLATDNLAVAAGQLLRHGSYRLDGEDCVIHLTHGHHWSWIKMHFDRDAEATYPAFVKRARQIIHRKGVLNQWDVIDLQAA